MYNPVFLKRKGNFLGLKKSMVHNQVTPVYLAFLDILLKYLIPEQVVFPFLHGKAGRTKFRGRLPILIPSLSPL